MDEKRLAEIDDFELELRFIRCEGPQSTVLVNCKTIIRELLSNLHKVRAERDALVREVERLQTEREQYRKRLEELDDYFARHPEERKFPAEAATLRRVGEEMANVICDFLDIDQVQFSDKRNRYFCRYCSATATVSDNLPFKHDDNCVTKRANVACTSWLDARGGGE